MAIMAFLRTAYQREWVRRWVRPCVRPLRPQKWVFLVGCYNSGTTITQDLIAAHPDVATLPWEGALITSVLPNPEDLGWTRMWLHCQDYMAMPAGQRDDLVDRMLRDWAPWWNRKNVSTFLEKSITNVTRMAWLDRHLDNSYFVGMVRDGYSVAEGICRKTRLNPRNARRWGETYPMEMAGQQWVLANEALLAGASQVKRYHQLRYESLVADPIAELSRVWNFLELPVPEMQIAEKELRIGGQRLELQTETNAGSWRRISADQYRLLTPVIAAMQEQLGYELRVSEV
jgi:hypothetical protein